MRRNNGPATGRPEFFFPVKNTSLLDCLQCVLSYSQTMRKTSTQCVRCRPVRTTFFFFLFLQPSPDRGGVAATTIIGEEVEWRPALLCANPLGHHVPAT